MYNVNSGSWVKYTTNEYFRSKITINSSAPISHNESLSYNTKITVDDVNYSALEIGPLNYTFGEINGTVEELYYGQTIQKISEINVGPFLGYFYPIVNFTYINNTIYKINNSLFKILINTNNLSKLPSELKYFLNPSYTNGIINLSSSLKFIFHGISNDTTQIQPSWWTNSLTFNRLILNFTLLLNLTSHMNHTYDGINWKLILISTQINMNYMVYIDKNTGIVTNMLQTGNIQYYESCSENIEPYYGLPYNLTIYIRKFSSILDSNVIIFGISNWILIIIGVIIFGLIFVVVYVLITSPKRTKKEEKFMGNILES